MIVFKAEKYIGLIALGFGVGAYGVLIGAGGGFVLMPLLLLIYPHESPELLTSISLAVVFFNTLSGSEAYALMKRIDYKTGFLFAEATIPGAVLGALNTAYVPRRLFDILFGVILLAAALFIGLRPRVARTHYHEALESKSPAEATSGGCTWQRLQLFFQSGLGRGYQPICGLCVKLFWESEAASSMSRP